MREKRRGNLKKPDRELLQKFEDSIRNKIPHLSEQIGGAKIVNPTPLLELTDLVKECARAEYGLDISDRDFRVFGKLESEILSGSVKMRPMAQIVEEAIRSGKLSRGQSVFEATSGNFGIALGLLGDLGLDVITLVSRKLQEGVLEELQKQGVKTVDLDVDICPAPGVQVDMDTLTAKVVSSNMRGRLGELGLDTSVFDNSRQQIEELLARQDVINLAKFLAKIYDGFCPEQYDNELNVAAHETVTAPEIDQQLSSLGGSLKDFRIVCTFGTGGTSGGLSRYVQKKYGKKSVHVVFPLSDQDVAGIRTREKAAGLRFYEPEKYAGQHEADFEEAARLLKFFVKRGHDIGESSALALYAVLQMVNFGLRDNFVVILADGVEKYKKGIEVEKVERSFEASLETVVSNIGSYSGILWTHAMFTPREEGIKLIADTLRVERGKIRVARTSDVERFITSGEIPDGLSQHLRESGNKPLFVCMSGNTSLRVAQLLGEGEIEAVSLTGGMTKLSQAAKMPMPKLVQLSRE